MGISESKDSYALLSQYNFAEDQLLTNNKLLFLQSKITKQHFIAREIQIHDRQEAHEIDCIINQKLINPSPFVTKLIDMEKKSLLAYCSVTQKFCLIFRRTSRLLSEQISQRLQRRVQFSLEQISEVISRVAKGLRYLRDIGHSHGALSSNTVSWPTNKYQLIQVIDVWSINDVRENKFFLNKEFSQQQKRLSRIQQQSNDLLNLGIIGKTMLDMSKNAQRYNPGLAEDIKHKIFVLFSENPLDRLHIYQIINNRKLEIKGKIESHLKAQLGMNLLQLKQNKTNYPLIEPRNQKYAPSAWKPDIPDKNLYKVIQYPVNAVADHNQYFYSLNQSINKQPIRVQQNHFRRIEPSVNNFEFNSPIAKLATNNTNDYFASMNKVQTLKNEPETRTAKLGIESGLNSARNNSSVAFGNSGLSSNLQYSSSLFSFQNSLTTLKDSDQQNLFTSPDFFKKIHGVEMAWKNGKFDKEINKSQTFIHRKQIQPIMQSSTPILNLTTQQKKSPIKINVDQNTVLHKQEKKDQNADQSQPQIIKDVQHKQDQSIKLQVNQSEKPQNSNIPDQVRSSFQSFTQTNNVIPEVNQHSDQEEHENPEQRQYVVEEYENGSRYEGEKLNGMRDGQGKFFYKEGSYYQGKWKQNNMHGYGKLFYPNNKIAYQGDWYIDQFHGFGKVYNDQPSQIVGSFDYTDFDSIAQKWKTYEGTLVCDSKEGFGKLILSNDEYYEGNFQSDRIHGEGMFVTISGSEIHGIWQDSKLIKIINSN